MNALSVHASCVLVEDGAILIRGPSGAGKSALALTLLEAAGRSGALARLVGDDRIGLTAQGGRLVARGDPLIAGRIEARGVGILPAEHEPAAIVRLVVDLVDDDGIRLPEPCESTIVLLGVVLPRVTSRNRPGLGTVVLRRYRVPNDTLMME